MSKQSLGLEDYPKLSVQDRMIHLTRKCSDMLAVQRWLDSSRRLAKNIYNVFNKTLQPQTAFILMDYIQCGAVQANAFIKGLLAMLL